MGGQQVTNSTGVSAGWSTSYQAGSSSAAGDSSTENDDTDADLGQQRGRRYSPSPVNGRFKRARAHLIHRPSHSLVVIANGNNSEVEDSRRLTARRSSPAPRHLPNNGPSSHFMTSSGVFFSTWKSSAVRYILPEFVHASVPNPFTRKWVSVSLDSRKAAEHLLLLNSLYYITIKLHGYPLDLSGSYTWNPLISLPNYEGMEVILLCIVSFIYMIFIHASPQKSVTSHPDVSPAPESHSLSPHVPDDVRDKRHNIRLPVSPPKTDFGFFWMTVPKNYRDSDDDGFSIGLLLPPLISSSLLYVSLQQTASHSTPIPSKWLIEPIYHFANPGSPPTALDALVISRRGLVNLATLCSTIMFSHMAASWWWENRFKNDPDAKEGERGSVPRSEARRLLLYLLFECSATLGMLAIRAFSAYYKLPIWKYMSYFDIAIASQVYQSALYIAIRLAHRSFTLGELGLVCFGGVAMFMELMNITVARMWPITTLYIRTYRLPTPLLILQTALIAGSFLTGFLLSPLLVLSRHIARRPVRRLRFPEEKRLHRKALAGGFYVGAALIVGGLIGLWARWCLGNRDPWLWVIFWLLEGRQPWTRPALLAYWALLCSISVAGWTRQLARSRRYRAKRSATADIAQQASATDTLSSGAQQSDGNGINSPAVSPLGITFGNLPNLPNLSNGSNVSQVLDAADKHVPTLGLNARRKFFHALAVVMFLPGIAVDPAFTHLSFSAAFALFTFAEYVRYFALYPFGISVHLFMNEFLDHKDSGTAILSHFYLLTGCAGSLWFEGPTLLLQYTGTLALGVGDALASIVGKRIGRHRWSPVTTKTLEGSVAFTLSIIVCAWALRLCGLAEPFSTARYTAVIALSSVLEALSDQNDNLTLPLYMWSILVAADL